MFNKIGDLKSVMEKSTERPVVIMKHSLTCPVSGAGKAQMDIFATTHEVFLVIVQDERELSDEIAEKLGVQHESPQVIIVMDGKAVQVFNHYDIKKEEVEKAIKV